MKLWRHLYLKNAQNKKNKFAESGHADADPQFAKKKSDLFSFSRT
jgi:hypothetical protein